MEVVVKTIKKHRAGASVEIAGVTLSFNHKLEARVEAEDAALVLRRDSSLSVSEDDAAKVEIQSTKKDKVDKEEVSTLKKQLKEKDNEIGNLRTLVAEKESLIVSLKAELESKAAEPVAKIEEKEKVETATSFRLKLNKKTATELKAIAKDSEFPEKEWGSMTKVMLLDYLTDKLFAPAK